MKEYPFYTGQPQKECVTTQATLPTLLRNRELDAKAYKADPGLIAAVNVALLLSQPLLVTGEPGTGKTQLAYSIECELGYKVFKFPTKSTSTARDLFYTYDALGRFHAARLKEGKLDTRDYITYNSLGLAILRSREFDEVQDYVPDGFNPGWKQRSIVLIDEIDKAPRDFPNDLLTGIEEMSFSIPEMGPRLGNKMVKADRKLRPVVVITSNSEKSLPDAFLRRCIFYHIPFPEDARLKEIVQAHGFTFEDRANYWLNEALRFFQRLRDPSLDLEKMPATAELLNWLTFLHDRMKEVSGDKLPPELLRSSIWVLCKSENDQRTAKSMIEGAG